MLRCDSILNHAFKICEGGVFHVSTQWRWLNDHHIQSSIGGGSAGQTCHENIIPLGARCPMPRELSEGCPPRHSVRDSARTRTGLGRFTKWSWTNVALSHRWLKLGWNRSRLPTPAFCSSDGSEPLTYLHGSANNFGLSAETAFLQPYTWNVSQYLRESLASSLSALLNLEGYRNCPSNRVQELGPNLRMIMVHRTVLQQQQLNNMWCDGSVTKEPQFVILVSQFSNYCIHEGNGNQNWNMVSKCYQSPGFEKLFGQQQLPLHWRYTTAQQCHNVPPNSRFLNRRSTLIRATLVKRHPWPCRLGGRGRRPRPSSPTSTGRVGVYCDWLLIVGAAPL